MYQRTLATRLTLLAPLILGAACRYADVYDIPITDSDGATVPAEIQDFIHADLALARDIDAGFTDPLRGIVFNGDDELLALCGAEVLDASYGNPDEAPGACSDYYRDVIHINRSLMRQPVRLRTTLSHEDAHIFDFNEAVVSDTVVGFVFVSYDDTQSGVTAADFPSDVAMLNQREFFAEVNQHWRNYPANFVLSASLTMQNIQRYMDQAFSQAPLLSLDNTALTPTMLTDPEVQVSDDPVLYQNSEGGLELAVVSREQVVTKQYDAAAQLWLAKTSQPGLGADVSELRMDYPYLGANIYNPEASHYVVFNLADGAFKTFSAAKYSDFVLQGGQVLALDPSAQTSTTYAAADAGVLATAGNPFAPWELPLDRPTHAFAHDDGVLYINPGASSIWQWDAALEQATIVQSFDFSLADLDHYALDGDDLYFEFDYRGSACLAVMNLKTARSTVFTQACLAEDETLKSSLFYQGHVLQVVADQTRASTSIYQWELP